ncbi:MAG: M24 family metallopeptidase [Armatimonadetes bacterium]|nr:M24 family metallopeptidase [Armatimonadota bacterium]MDW8121196.1 M24 family metallopeptidase [Armatimonadota bacterium]
MVDRATVGSADFPLFQKAQDALRQLGPDGWLLYDWRRRNPVAAEIARLDPYPTRPWFCLIPPEGSLVWLVPRLELSTSFASVPGQILTYGSRSELVQRLSMILSSYRTVAMEYSRKAELPQLSCVDAGTVELIQSLQVTVVSSADLVHLTLGVLSASQVATHRKAAQELLRVKDEAFAFIGDALVSGKTVTEWDVVVFVLERFKDKGLVSDDRPIVAVMGNSVFPHYFPTPSQSSPIGWGDFVLLDLFARLDEAPDSVYADITWCGYTGSTVPPRFEQQFALVREARDKSLEFLSSRLKAGCEVRGYELDQVARSVLADRGVGERFIHRTGHSLGTSVHGWGTNIDSYETVDRRILCPGSLFTIEPGLYGPEIGTRSEINVFISEKGAEITTLPLQESITTLI